MLHAYHVNPKHTSEAQIASSIQKLKILGLRSSEFWPRLYIDGVIRDLSASKSCSSRANTMTGVDVKARLYLSNEARCHRVHQIHKYSN